MRRLLPLAPMLLLLADCSVFAAGPRPDPEPVPPVVIMSVPESETRGTTATENPTDPATDPYTGTAPVELRPVTDSACAEPDDLQPETDLPTGTSPACPPPAGTPLPGLPTEWQPGDTTPTWRPELADGFPADTDCSDALLLEKWMTVEGLTAQDLEARRCDQLILVAAQPTDGVETVTICYERGADGSLLPAAGLTRMAGHLGKNGLRHNRRRNTNTTPAGLWAISAAFGNELPPEGLKLPWRQVTPESDWVCDENSIYFNTWQERGDPTLIERWSEDVEHLVDYPELYAWACVIEFNRPPDVVPDRGCAIFLHCSEKGTGGCVGLIQEDMRAVLTWLDPEKNPYILITGTEKTE